MNLLEPDPFGMPACPATMSSSTTLPAKMLSTFVHPTDPITTTIVDTPMPSTLGPKEVLIGVCAAASNPKDWLHLVSRNESFNSGDDIAGVVAGFGSDVTGLKVGNRVAA